MNKNSKIYVAGHRGLVGSAIVKHLTMKGYSNIVAYTHSELDLTRQTDVEDFFEKEKPEYVFLVAAKVGGILYLMQNQGEVFYENTMISGNVIRAATMQGTKKLLFIGGTSIYPANAPQPIKESYLMSGELEPTLESYGLSKIVGTKMCEYFNRQYETSFIPIAVTNLYGEGDNDDLKTAHVMPALIRKFAEAVKSNASAVEIWGTGNARREFLHVDDMADACVFLMNSYNDNALVNVGSGTDLSIRDLSELIKRISGFAGELIFDALKPDGVMRRCADCSKLFGLGWRPKISLDRGITELYEKYRRSIE